MAETITTQRCAYCGVANGSVHTHSGVLECQSCWDWRKHLRDEAKFWTTGISNLFNNDYGSGPDPNDNMFWDSLGIRNEVTSALVTLKNLRDRYETMLREHRTWVCACGHMRYHHSMEGNITKHDYESKDIVGPCRRWDDDANDWCCCNHYDDMRSI